MARSKARRRGHVLGFAEDLVWKPRRDDSFSMAIALLLPVVEVKVSTLLPGSGGRMKHEPDDVLIAAGYEETPGSERLTWIGKLGYHPLIPPLTPQQQVLVPA